MAKIRELSPITFAELEEINRMRRLTHQELDTELAHAQKLLKEAVGKGEVPVAMTPEGIQVPVPKSGQAFMEGESAVQGGTKVPLAPESKPGAEPGKSGREVEGGNKREATGTTAEVQKVGQERRTKYWHAGYVENLTDTQMLLGVQASNKGPTTLGNATKSNAWKAGMAWVGESPKPIYSSTSELIGYCSADKSRVFRLHYKPKDRIVRANFQEFTVDPARQNALTEIKNVRIDILD